MRYKGKKFKKSTSMPPLHKFKLVTTGNLRREKVRGFTITRAEFNEAIEDTFDALDYYDSEVLDAVRYVVEPVAASIDRFPLGEWITDRGCGCIVGEALVAHDVITRHDFASPEHRTVYTLLRDAYGPIVGDALDAFGVKVDRHIQRLVTDVGGDWEDAGGEGRATWPTDHRRAERVVFIQD